MQNTRQLRGTNYLQVEKAHFHSECDVLYPIDYTSASNPYSPVDTLTEHSNIILLRPFLKEGHYNHLISYFLQNRPRDGSPIVLSVGAINKVISHQIGLNRTTIIRQLERLVVESVCPKEAQNPFIGVKEFGEKKKGTTSNRGFIISFKGRKYKEHVTRFFNLEVEEDEAYLHALTAKQILAAYEHEAQRLEDGHDLRRLRAKDLARRLGVSLRTIRRLRKDLMAQGFLTQEVIEEEFEYKHYNYENGKRLSINSIEIKQRFRVVYTPTKIHSQNSIVQNVTPYLIPSKILDFTNKGSLNSAGTSPVKSAPRQKPSQPFSQFQNAWESYEKIFTPKEGDSLRQSLGAAKKYGVHLPTPERVIEALERSKGIVYLKLAHRVGFQEAEKAQLLAKGGTLNDSSVHWKKDIQGKHARLGFLWILKHTEDILAGKYDRKELSEQAKGKVWGGHGQHPAPNTSVKRTEVPTEWFNDYLIGSTSQKDLSALLARFWWFFGWEFYETWIDPCRFVKTEAGEWKMVAPNRFHAEVLEKKLNTGKKRVAYDEGTTPAKSKIREAFDAWLQEKPESQAPREEKANDDTGDITENSKANTREKGGQEMGIVPANDDEGVIPAYVDDDAPHKNGQIPPHMGGRAKGQNLEAHGRESEEELLSVKKERQERMLKAVVSCTNMHCSERSLRAHTIEHYGISAYQCWFEKCKIEITEDVARYIAPSDFIGYEIERRYEVILENYTANGEEITVRKKKEKL